jgi:hypothetical protein
VGLDRLSLEISLILLGVSVGCICLLIEFVWLVQAILTLFLMSFFL